MQDYIKGHDFLGKIFPGGICMKNILLSNICIKISGGAVISLHTKDKPKTDVKKWGEWGRNYNTLVINLLLVGVNNFCIDGWDELDWGCVKGYKEGNTKKLFFNSGKCVVRISYSEIIFQGCDRYLL